MPTANANPTGNGYALIPTNADGSINVKIISTQSSQNVVITGWKDNNEDGDNEIKDLMTSGLPVKGN